MLDPILDLSFDTCNFMFFLVIHLSMRSLCSYIHSLDLVEITSIPVWVKQVSSLSAVTEHSTVFIVHPTLTSFLVVLDVEPRVPLMLDECSTIELQSQPPPNTLGCLFHRAGSVR